MRHKLQKQKELVGSSDSSGLINIIDILPTEFVEKRNKQMLINNITVLERVEVEWLKSDEEKLSNRDTTSLI
jgi:hypothetical protein